MAEFGLTGDAEKDLLDIYLFGIERFGPAQAARYLEDLDECFRKLAEFPRMGRKADIIARGLRRHEHVSHVVLYYIGDGGIEVAAVVHKSSLRGLRS